MKIQFIIHFVIWSIESIESNTIYLSIDWLDQIDLVTVT